MSFDFKEFEELRNRFVKMDKEWDKFLREFMLEMGLRALAKTKLRQRAVGAIDTGLMWNSWQLGNSNYTIQTFADSTQKGKVRVAPDKKNASYKDATVESVKKSGDTLEITIFNPVEYASYVEYGHAQDVGRYVPVLGKKLKSPWVKGRYIATIAINSMKSEIPKRFEASFKAWIKKLGVE